MAGEQIHVSQQGQPGTLWDQLREVAAAKAQGALRSFDPKAAEGRTAWDLLKDGLYDLGRGYTDRAREKLAGAIRQSPEGQRVEREVERQRIAELMQNPLVLVVGGGLLLLALRGLKR